MKRLICITLLIVGVLLLSGCYGTQHSMVFDENWDCYMITCFILPDLYSTTTTQKEVEDLIKRLRYFGFEFGGNVDVKEGRVTIYHEKPIPFSQLNEGFVTKQALNNGEIKLEIKIPTLVTAKDHGGKLSGGMFAFDVYIPGRIIDANTFQYENNYTMQHVLKGETRGRAVWALSPDQLTTERTFWIIYEPFLQGNEGF
jgi:hypothetical protein